MLGQIVSFFIGVVLIGLVAVILDYNKQKKNTTIKKTPKEYIVDFEQRNKKGIKYFGIICSVLLGLIILLNLGLYFRNSIANTVGSGLTLGSIKRTVLIVGILIWVGTLVKNIITGGFSITKFIKGFNIFSGATQGKLIYYGIIFALVAAVSLGIYHRMTQETTETNYRTQVKAEQVIIDQKSIYPTQEDRLFVGIKLFGIKLGITLQSSPKIVESKNTAIKVKGNETTTLENNTINKKK